MWDLEIIWEERHAWIDTMLSEAAPDPEAYLDECPSVSDLAPTDDQARQVGLNQVRFNKESL